MDICAIYGFCVGGKSFHYSNPSLAQTYIHFYELILLVRLPYVIGELFSKYQPGTKRTCLIIVILRQLPGVHAATSPCGRDAVFHTIPTSTVFYSVPSIVEVSGGCQSVNIICLRQRRRWRRHIIMLATRDHYY